MARSKNIFLLLIIYTLFSLPAKSQNLHLKISGKTPAETHVIDSLNYQKKHPSFLSLTGEIDSTLIRIQKKGYVDVRYSPIEKKKDSLFTTRFSLGKKYSHLYLYYDTLPLDEKTLKSAGIDFNENYIKLPFSETEAFLAFLNRQIANKGQPFSFVQLQQIKKRDKGVISAKLNMVSSKTRRIDRIIIKGYEKFPASFLKYFIGIKTGRPFNKEKLDKQVQGLENLRFASSIKPPEVQFTQDSTTVYLYLKKEKSNSFDGFLGFSNNEENSKLQLTGQVDIQLLNNLNYGESLSLQYNNDANEQIQFTANLSLPFLFRTPLGLNLGLDIFKKDSSFVTTSQKIEATYRFGTKIEARVGYLHAESNNLLEESTQTAGDIPRDFNANFINAGATYRVPGRFSSLFPVKTDLGIDIAIGKRASPGLENRQLKGMVFARHNFQLNPRNRIYVSNTTSVLISDAYLANELFRFGGVHSVRGFTENSISASLFSATQTEYRYLLAENLYLHSVLDYAYYKNPTANLQENLYGIGFGLGLETDAGIMRVIFANGKADEQNFEFANTKIHLSLVAFF